MQHLRLPLSALGAFVLVGPIASTEIVSVAVDADAPSLNSDALIQKPESDLDALRMREDFTLNKPRPTEERLEGIVDPTELDPSTYTHPSVDAFSNDALIWEQSLPLSDFFSIETRAGYWPEIQRRDVVGLDTEGPTYDVKLYGFGAKLDVGDKIYLRSDYTRTDTSFHQSGAFTIGGGVNLVEVAKLVRDLSD